MSLEIEQADQSDVGFNFPTLPPVLPAPMKPSSVSLPTVVVAPNVITGGASLAARGAMGVPPPIAALPLANSAV